MPKRSDAPLSKARNGKIIRANVKRNPSSVPIAGHEPPVFDGLAIFHGVRGNEVHEVVTVYEDDFHFQWHGSNQVFNVLANLDFDATHRKYVSPEWVRQTYRILNRYPSPESKDYEHGFKELLSYEKVFYRGHAE